MRSMGKPVMGMFVLLLIVAAIIAGCTGTDAKENTRPAVTAATVPVTAATTEGTAVVPAHEGITITQTDGTKVVLTTRPERIIVTNSDAAEMMIVLGAADKIVGITESTKNVSYIMMQVPDAVSIGDWQTPNIEQMLALKPDVVISYASSKPKNLDQMIAANITILYLDCYRLPKLAQDARAVGVLTGNEERAEEYAQMVENTTSLVMRRVATLSPEQLPTVYFEGYSDYTAAGTGSGSDELLMMAGGKNTVAAVSTASSPKVSAEWVVSENPDYVMKVIPAKETRPYSVIADTLKARAGWDTMSAARENRICLFASAIEYGPKAYIGLSATAKVLHPELFVDLDPQEMLDQYAAEYVPDTNTTMMMYP